LIPRSIECLRSYTLRQFSHDLIAGLTVGLVALPLAMAFAIASGVPPQAGLYTAVVAGFLISALGGSRLQIGGPTGAFVVIVAGIVVKFGMGGLALVGIMAGVLLLVMGFTAQLTWWPDPMVDLLAQRGFHVIRYDNRDVGRARVGDRGRWVAAVVVGHRHAWTGIGANPVEHPDEVKRSHVPRATAGDERGRGLANHRDPAQVRALQR